MAVSGNDQMLVKMRTMGLKNILPLSQATEEGKGAIEDEKDTGTTHQSEDEISGEMGS
jgi:hypothetical protein